MKFAREFGMLGAPLSLIASGSPADVPSPAALVPHLTLGKAKDHLEVFDRPPDNKLGFKWSWKGQIVEMARFTHGLKNGFKVPLPADAHDEVSGEMDEFLWLLRANEMLAAIVAPRLVPAAGYDKLSLRFDPRSLIGAMWLQAAQVAAEGEIRLCETCGHPIAVDRTTGARTNAKFCSNACRFRNYRKRQARAAKLSKRGLTASQIAKKLGTDTATVLGWIK
jgi:hypothetical protein